MLSYTESELREIFEEIRRVLDFGRSAAELFYFCYGDGWVRTCVEVLGYLRDHDPMMLEYYVSSGGTGFVSHAELRYVMFEVALDQLPLFINRGLLGLVARWRLRLDR